MSTFKGFSTVELRKPKRSLFDLSHEKRVSTRMGRLTPVFMCETIPNDTFRVRTEILLRLAPLITPIMHRVNVFVHFFFVANRLLWKDWELFITGGRLGTETPPIPPNCSISTTLLRNMNLMDTSSLVDYMGVPNLADANQAQWVSRSIDVLPLAAHYKVWYDYYRDRNYETDNTMLPLASGLFSDSTTIDNLFKIRNRDWQRDMYTSALPWTQRGSQVLMPIQAVVNQGRKTDLTNFLVSGNINVTLNRPSTSVNIGPLEITDSGQKTVELVGANTTVTINDFRRSMYLQQWLERNALAGSRYNESIWAHFNRRTSDGRLQRAEYLGGGKVPVKISEVLTTAFSDDGGTSVPPGDMSGHGISFGNSNRFTYNCEEHGFILGIMSVMPTSSYMQGAPRMFFGRNTFLDYPWPSFANLGEQPVFNYEIFMDNASIPVSRPNQPVFGYQSRYVDWKYIPSSSHGDFRTTLEQWHLTRKFASQPALGQVFCTFEDALQDRVFAVGAGEDNLWAYIYNNVTVVRSLPYFSTPGGLSPGVI